MKKFTVWLLFFLHWSITSQEPHPALNHKAAWIAHELYGPSSINVAPGRLHEIQALIVDLLSASPYALLKITQNVVQKLEEQKNIFNATITLLEQTEKPVPPKIFFDRFVIEQYLAHLKAYEQTVQQQLTMPEKMSGYLHNQYEMLKTWVTNRITTHDETPFITKVSHELMEYCNFERTTVLENYHTVAQFLHATTYPLLPPIMYFWQSNEIRNKLRLRSKLLVPEVQVQLWAELGMIALQSVLMGGSSMYNTFISELDRKKFEEYTKQQQDIQNNFSQFISQTRKNQNAVRIIMTEAFKNSAKTNAQQYQAQNKQVNDETIYLFKAVNLNPPITHDLEYPSIWSDQQFEFSPMNTPANRPGIMFSKSPKAIGNMIPITTVSGKTVFQL